MKTMRTKNQSLLTAVGICLLQLAFNFHTSSASAAPISYAGYAVKPKLIVVIVIEQFRADYLTRFPEKFLSATGPKTSVGGFRYLMSNGAYFPMAKFDFLQNMTCPGHAAIMTGSSPSRTHIPLNEWIDRESSKRRYCVADDVDGLSPRQLQGTTVGDEIKNTGAPSRSVSLALKDRAAILLGGHRSDISFWIDKGAWTSSNYYGKKLPVWLASENERLKKDLDKDYVWGAQKAKRGALESYALPYGAEITTDAAIAALRGAGLGKSGTTDVLTLSYSTHDILGHAVGPNAQEMESLTIAEDKEIARLLNAIKAEVPGGLKTVGHRPDRRSRRGSDDRLSEGEQN